MAAVQDLVRWLKSRGSARRKVKADDNVNSTKHPDGSSRRKLASRSGMALPPTPPPGFVNWPDISRDCARSPYHIYDEIPAYAIDTRLDILRDAQIRGAEHDNGIRTQDGGSLRRSRSARCLQRSREAEFEGGSDACSGIQRVHVRETPWHHFREWESPSDVMSSVDQLGQWVSVQDNLEALSIQANRIHSQSRDQEVPNSRAIRAFDTSYGHESDARVSCHRYPPSSCNHRDLVLSDCEVSPCKEKVDSWSDDSGVSSPSGGSIAREDSSQLRGYRSVQPRATDSSSHLLPPRLPSRRTSTSQKYPRGYTHHHDNARDCESGHEYSSSSASEVSDTISSCMSPLEYIYYLRKTERNLLKTRGVRNLVKDDTSSETSHVVDDSLDLTSVTSLSDSWSTYSDEVCQLTSSLVANANNSTSAQRTTSESAKVSQEDKKDFAPFTRASTAGNSSAFRPYESRGRRHSCSNLVVRNKSSPVVSALEAKEPKEMSLEERLSCRVTTGIPARLRAVSKTHTSHMVTMATGHSSNAPKNSVLSDIMRINYDRQILSLV